MPLRHTPPFRLTEETLSLCGELERLIGRLEGAKATVPQPLLRKRNHVRTVLSTVAIEGNTMTEAQVTALVDGVRVAGAPREIREVTNANAAYNLVEEWRASSERDLLATHRTLMTGLVDDPGKYRHGNVGVLRGARVVHMAPPHERVPSLMRQLLEWAGRARTPALVKSCVIHYELLFIHPFSDGNGRIARLWQQVALRAANPVWRFVAIESVIRERQTAYYAALNRADHAGDATGVIEYLLESMRDALSELVRDVRPQRATPEARLVEAEKVLRRRWFSRADYLSLDRSIATATASRDLAGGVAAGALEVRGARRLTEYRFRRRLERS
ncbi:MAG TPA: Fic family protein [Kofleriaceae bacterium]|jgi:Fic family protein